jgi:hypothetical protein
MTELATYTPAAVPAAPTHFADPTGGRLVAWADGLAAAHRIGSALCQTAFVPASFRGKPEEAAAAILYGDEIGLTPTQALQSVHVISGRPGLYARAMVALAMSKGHEVWTVEKSDAKVTVAGRRKGSTHVHEETWTTARAQKAGYTNNKKYATDPQAMLYARAAADVVRQIAPDALAGLDYAVEELELSESPTVTTITRSATPPAKVQRKPITATPEPQEPPLAPVVELRSDAQSKKLWTLAAESGMDEAGFRAWLADTLGREVESTKTLTKAEAHKVIELLEADRDAPADEAYDAELVDPA